MFYYVMSQTQLFDMELVYEIVVACHHYMLIQTQLFVIENVAECYHDMLRPKKKYLCFRLPSVPNYCFSTYYFYMVLKKNNSTYFWSFTLYDKYYWFLTQGHFVHLSSCFAFRSELLEAYFMLPLYSIWGSAEFRNTVHNWNFRNELYRRNELYSNSEKVRIFGMYSTTWNWNYKLCSLLTGRSAVRAFVLLWPNSPRNFVILCFLHFYPSYSMLWFQLGMYLIVFATVYCASSEE